MRLLEQVLRLFGTTDPAEASRQIRFGELLLKNLAEDDRWTLNRSLKGEGILDPETGIQIIVSAVASSYHLSVEVFESTLNRSFPGTTVRLAKHHHNRVGRTAEALYLRLKKAKEDENADRAMRHVLGE